MNVSDFIRRSSNGATKLKMPNFPQTTAPTKAMQDTSDDILSIDETIVKRMTPTSSSHKQFPGKLHDLLTFAETHNLDHIISWDDNGKEFTVHDSELLLDLLPRFFSQTKFRSFERQLNIWSFSRTSCHGIKKTTTYKHPYFIKGQKLLCQFVTRQSFKSAAVTKKGRRTANRTNTTTLHKITRPVASEHNDNIITKSTFVKPTNSLNKDTLVSLLGFNTIESFSDDFQSDQMDINDNMVNHEHFDCIKSDLEQIEDLLQSCKDNMEAIEQSSNFCLQDGDLAVFEGRFFYFVEDEDNYIAQNQPSSSNTFQIFNGNNMTNICLEPTPI